VKRVLATASFALLFVLVSAAAVASKDRPHEGKIIAVDQTAQMITVQGEKGDQWTLYWTETTKMKDELTTQELRVGDSVHFDYVEKDGKMWVTELRRTGKAK
jgi:Cu/Ag efflux protein CusF